MAHFPKKTGFTLIELLITISIIAILVVVVFSALNPLRLFAESRNAQRWINVSELLNSLHIYVVRNRGDVPNEDLWEGGKAYILGDNSSGCSVCNATTTESICLELTDLIDEKQISKMPIDPKTGTKNKTDFYVYREEGTIFLVGSCSAELGEKIELIR